MEFLRFSASSFRAKILKHLETARTPMRYLGGMKPEIIPSLYGVRAVNLGVTSVQPRCNHGVASCNLGALVDGVRTASDGVRECAETFPVEASINPLLHLTECARRK